MALKAGAERVCFARHSREGGLGFTSAQPNIQGLSRENFEVSGSMTVWKDGAEVSGFPPARE
jgi:hypothetical protein